jgi:hypothetical protein
VPCSFETTLCLRLRICEIVFGCIKLAMSTLKWTSDVADQRVCEAVQKYYPGQQLQLNAATANLVRDVMMKYFKANQPAVLSAATPTAPPHPQPGGGSGEAGASSARHLPLVPGSVSNSAPLVSAASSAAAASMSCAASSGDVGDACSSNELAAGDASVCTSAPPPPPHREDWIEGFEYGVIGRNRVHIVTKYCLGSIDVMCCSCSAWFESPIPRHLRTCIHLRRALGDRAEILRIGHEYLARVSVAAKIASLVANKRKSDGSPHDGRDNKKVKAEQQAVNLGS